MKKVLDFHKEAILNGHNGAKLVDTVTELVDYGFRENGNMVEIHPYSGLGYVNTALFNLHLAVQATLPLTRRICFLVPTSLSLSS
jgi:hypothetical protein